MMLSLLVEDILLRILNISSVPATLAFGQVRFQKIIASYNPNLTFR